MELKKLKIDESYKEGFVISYKACCLRGLKIVIDKK